jgi:hypothetical protein
VFRELVGANLVMLILFDNVRIIAHIEGQPLDW